MKTSLSYRVARLARKYGYDFNSRNNEGIKKMLEDISKLGPAGISFSISTQSDGSWYAESTNVDGLLTGGFKLGELDETIKDAIFTYYDIDPKHCDDLLLKGSGDAQILKQQFNVAEKVSVLA